MNLTNTNHFPFIFDKLGILTAGGCIVHCLLIPFLLLVTPGLVAEIFENEAIHILLASFALFFISVAVARGYQHHKSLIPLIIGSAGLTLIWGSLLVEDPHWLERTLTSVGALSTAAAHILNHRFARHKRLRR
jgi:hypothetical protein